MGTDMIRLLTILACAFILAGCSSLRSIQPTYEMIDYPSGNAVSTANIGDTVLEKGKRYTFDAIQLGAPLMKSAGLMAGYEIPAQRLAATYEDDKYVYYSASRMILKDILFPDQATNGGVCISKSDPEEIRVFLVAGACTLSISGTPALQKTKANAETSPSFVQELIYNGRTGDFVKFLYREFSNNYVRGDFSQEVQYDLTEGNEIGFKDARIEIISATNTELNYRVVESFPDPE